MATKVDNVVADYRKTLEKQQAELAKFTDALKERRSELLGELKEIEQALGINSKPFRPSSSASAGGGTIRWGSKNNTFIAETVANQDGISMADLKAAAKKSKLNEMSIYQAVRTLVKSQGLVEEGGLLKEGPNFPPSK